MLGHQYILSLGKATQHRQQMQRCVCVLYPWGERKARERYMPISQKKSYPKICTYERFLPGPVAHTTAEWPRCATRR